MMTTDQVQEEFRALCGECELILESKNSDYSACNSDFYHNFRRTASLAGVTTEIGIFIRLCDKINRISNLLGNKEPSVEDETLEDTLQDALNYIAILLIHRRLK